MNVGFGIFLFALLLSKVSLEDTVKGYVGDSAVLNCSFKVDKSQVQDVNWMYNHKNIVYMFSPGKSQGILDDEKFGCFPKEIENGNYSIKIKNLEIKDKGVYTCMITPVDYHKNIQLIIEEQTFHHNSTKGTTDPKTENPKHGHVIIPVVAVFLFILVILLIILFIKYDFGRIRKIIFPCCSNSTY